MIALERLKDFIVEAKANTYVGDGMPRPSSRPGSHDIGYEKDNWRYLDSYFGGTDFAGQEAVWLDGEPHWAMNYFGRIIRPDLINAEKAGVVIKAALQAMYREKRHFLGGMELRHAHGYYIDSSRGDTGHFSGHETIFVDGEEAYELEYRGGLIKR
ncbi:DUF5680 domain-containing protein [Ensifer sp. MJa1]|uniref:DUF5680 domain-containing protein n=1 Tax=Ensifer sp. MJa1 TaxID=2919888 RepID=UPI00300BD910